MKFTVSLVSMLLGGVVAKIPRATLHGKEGQEKTEFGSQTLDNHLEVLKFKQMETSVEKEARVNRGRRLGGKGSNTAAPTETPEFFFEVDDDDSIVTTLLNGGFSYIDPFDFITKCIGDFSCEGRVKTHVTGVMIGNECSLVSIAAGAVGNNLGQDPGKFAVTCPTALEGATGVVQDCTDTLGTGNCDLLLQPEFGFQNVGSGAIFNMPAPGVNVIVEVTCCPL